MRLDQILASLDGDTQNYLLLLLSRRRGEFHRNPAGRTNPARCRAPFKRFEPLDRDTRTFATLLLKRSHNLGLSDPQPNRSPPRSAASTASSRR